MSRAAEPAQNENKNVTNGCCLDEIEISEYNSSIGSGTLNSSGGSVEMGKSITVDFYPFFNKMVNI